MIEVIGLLEILMIVAGLAVLTISVVYSVLFILDFARQGPAIFFMYLLLGIVVALILSLTL